MEICDLLLDNISAIQQVAQLLMEGFNGAWSSQDQALEEVHLSLQKDHISRVVLDTEGSVLGWIAGESSYEGHVWEMHPLIVAPHYQYQGIGRALVQDFETQVKARGGITIMLGTDDERDQTSLSGIDLYPSVLSHAQNIQNLKKHPYEFYQKQGYVIVGVIPDANGPGKPDILMAKSVR